MFSSRSDFIRDAIRSRLIEVRRSILLKGAKEKPSGRELEREEKIVSEAMEERESEYKFGGVH